MVEFRFFADRNFVGAVVVALIISFAMMGVFFFLALYMQDILGYSPLEAGIRFLPSTLMIVGLAPVAGRLADRFGARWLIVGGLTILTASLYSFSGIEVDSGYLDLLPGFMLFGIGIALTMSPMSSAAMNAVPVRKPGSPPGVLSMFRMVGGALGIAVTGAVFQSLVGSQLRDGDPQHFVDGLRNAMVVSAAVALLGAAVAALAIRGLKRWPIASRWPRRWSNPGGEVAAAEAVAADKEPETGDIRHRFRPMEGGESNSGQVAG